MKSLARVLFALAVVFGLTGISSAQVTSAVLQGSVTDDQSGVLAGVTVAVTNTETGHVRTVVSDGAGFFRASALPPGPYSVEASLDGFKPYSRTGLVLTVGQTASVDIRLSLASLSEAVTVSADAPLVDTTTNALGTTITNQQLDDLPLAGRDFAGLARLAPGVTGVGSDGITTGGQLARNNSVVIDGTSNDEQGIASTRGSVSLESVREYVVYTNQFSAEHGLAAGALINVVTRSGTNALEGRAFVFHRDDALDAQNPFSKAQGPARRRSTRPAPAVSSAVPSSGTPGTTSVPTRCSGRRPPTSSPRCWCQSISASSRRRATGIGHFFKSDYELPRNNRLTGRYRYDAPVKLGANIGGLNPYERGYDQRDKYKDLVVSLTSVLSSRTVNEVRVLAGTLSTYYSVDGYADPTGVSISRPSINLGKASNMPQGWDSVRYQFADTISHTIGRHDLKAGVDIQLDDQNTYFLGNKDGTFTFRTDLPFDPNDRATYPFQYTQTIGDWYDPRRNEIYSGFAQDTWRATDRLTFNLGVRYDTETIFARARAIDVDQDLDNFAPRLGVAWMATGDGRTVVRGGYGVYYDQGFNNISGNISNSARSSNVTVLNPGFPDPYAGGTIAATKPSVTVAASHIDTPSSRTFSAGARREVAPGLAVSVDAVRTLGYNLFNAIDINAPLPGGVRPNADYLRIVQYETTGRSWTNALLVALERRTGRGPLFNVSYTLSKAERNVEDFGFVPQDSYNRAAERALSNNDRRHQLVTSVVWMLPFGFQAAGLLQARSGLPWNVTTGSDNNGDQSVNDRPDLAVPDGDPADRATYGSAFTGRVGNLGRNSAEGPGFVQVDLRLSKFVRVKRYTFEGFVEAFNLLNRANLGIPNGTLTSSAFGRPTALAFNATPRQLELGFRFNF